jgi:hypothetical protein
MMRWQRPEMLKLARKLTKHMKTASKVHMKAMHGVMAHCVATPEHGLPLKPKWKWDGNPNFEFEIAGMADSSHATDVATWQSVSGCSTFLEGAPSLSMKISGQKSVTLSTAEAELALGTSCSQDMPHEMKGLESIGLKVKKPMILHDDNEGAVDLTNNCWSVGGQTRHIEVRQHFLGEIKEEGLINTVWCSGEIMSSDSFTKNLERPLFERHGATCCGVDQATHKGHEKLSRGECRRVKLRALSSHESAHGATIHTNMRFSLKMNKLIMELNVRMRMGMKSSC